MPDRWFPLLAALLFGPISVDGWSCGGRAHRSEQHPIPEVYLFQAAASCPVGDQVHVAVYDFVVRALAQEQAELSREQARAQIAENDWMERSVDLKSARASVVETPFSHILGALCRSEPACVSLAVYGRAGVAVGLSSMGRVVDRHGIADDARWADMSRQELAHDGWVEPLSCADATAAGLLCTTNYVSVTYPVYEEDRFFGVARCIMDISQIHRQSER